MAQMRTAPKPTTILGRRCRVLLRLDKCGRTKGRGSPPRPPPPQAITIMAKTEPLKCPAQVATKDR